MSSENELPKQVKFRLYPRETIALRKFAGSVTIAQTSSLEEAVAIRQLWVGLIRAEENDK